MWGEIIGGGLAALGSLVGANKQAGAAQNAANMTAAQFKQVQQDLRPWYSSGREALGQLDIGLGLGPNTNAAGYGDLMKPFTLADFNASPAYQFNLQQGQQAIDKGAAARGMYYAPQTLQDLGRFQQGLASNEFQNAFQNYQQQQGNQFNRLFAQSGTGQNAAAQTGGFGAGATANISDLLTSRGAAQAGGIVGATNAIGQGFGNYYNNQLQQQILDAWMRQQGPIYGQNPNTLGGNV